MIGFLGLGHMGEPMVLNLLKAGRPVIAWSRSDAKYPLVTSAGGRVADSPEAVFKEARIVLMMLANGEAIDQVLRRGTEDFAGLVANHVVVHMGTTAPSYSAALADAIRDAGGEYVEAPVSGSRKPAEAGELIGMLAGTPEVIAEVEAVVEPMLLKSVICGGVPQALRMKLAVNLFLITQVAGLAEAFNFATEHDLDLSVFRDVLDSGPMASAVSRIKLAKMVEGDFTVQAALRDVHYNSRLISDALAARSLTSPLMTSSTDLFRAADELGHGGEDMAAVVHALRHGAKTP